MTLRRHPEWIGELVRCATLAETLLDKVGGEIADVEGGVSGAVEVELEQGETVAVDEHLMGVEVTMSASQRPYSAGIIAASRSAA
jgi:hypothetical protein